jgi:hypothetical protein
VEFLRDRVGGQFLAGMPLKMNAAAEVLRLRHWPPRGVYTRWRPRKRFCSGIVCIPPTSERKLSALGFPVCSILDTVRLFFVIFPHVNSAVPPRKAIRTNQFQNGTVARRCARVHRMATPARAVGRLLRLSVAIFLQHDLATCVLYSPHA